VRGVADFSAASRVHVVCHCGDCSAYARHLGREGAIEIVQMTPAQVRIIEGAEQLRCLRLTERGLTRWFTACCGTPLANTVRSPRAPFVGVMRCVLVTDDEALLGAKVHVNGGRRTPLAVVLRAAWFLIVGFIARRHRPSPFFDAKGELVARPEVLTRSGAAPEHVP